ncbi:hypothetical protein PROFUN_07443 [Planoprotostelium fungivorum]|uniref:Uncharacterized protein n=1 Tax=Planoprotostelium fungivorum TaxID=1890364 RepID=A0A2P6NLI6_9EUKA|nr:hypothetical protein PROFUN_07443 [Planoprotostelium fungivorum]
MQSILLHPSIEDRYRHFFRGGGHLTWAHDEWKEFIEELLTYASQNDLHPSHYLTERALILDRSTSELVQLPACYLFKGQFVPSADHDGLFWKPSRGSVKIGEKMMRRYHYARHRNLKLKRLVSYLDHNKWCFVEYHYQEQPLSPIDFHSLHFFGTDFHSLLRSTRPVDTVIDDGMAPASREEMLHRMNLAATGQRLPESPALREMFESDPFSRPPEGMTFVSVQRDVVGDEQHTFQTFLNRLSEVDVNYDETPSTVIETSQVVILIYVTERSPS